MLICLPIYLFTEIFIANLKIEQIELAQLYCLDYMSKKYFVFSEPMFVYLANSADPDQSASKDINCNKILQKNLENLNSDFLK